MTNTIEALDRFTQALEIMPPKPARPPESAAPAHLPESAAPAPARIAADPEPPQSGEVMMGPVIRSAERDPAGVKAAEPAQSRAAAKRCDGITRQGLPGDWQRPVRLAALALTVGLGLRFVVQGSVQAAQRYGQRWVKQSLACSAHDHPARVAARHVAAPHHGASPHHRTRKRAPGQGRRTRIARRARKRAI